MTEWKRVARVHDPTACSACFYVDTEHPRCFRNPLEVCAHPDAKALWNGVHPASGVAREYWCKGQRFKRGTT